MSRIGKAPITIPAGVTITVSKDNVVSVKGPKGELTQAVDSDITVSQEDGILTVQRPSEQRNTKHYTVYIAHCLTTWLLVLQMVIN
jgi:large subunit ribosomal protein L6